MRAYSMYVPTPRLLCVSVCVSQYWPCMSYVSCSLVWKAEPMSDSERLSLNILFSVIVPKNVRKRSRSLPSKYTLKAFRFSCVPNVVSLSLGLKLYFDCDMSPMKSSCHRLLGLHDRYVCQSMKRGSYSPVVSKVFSSAFVCLYLTPLAHENFLLPKPRYALPPSRLALTVASVFCGRW